MVRKPRAVKRRRAKSKVDAPSVSRRISATEHQRIRQAVELQIDEFMKKVGYSDPSKRTDEQGWRWFEFGSARGRAGLVQSESDGQVYLRAESLVMELPSDQEMIPPLMRELLEANMTIAGTARFGISGEGVFVCATIPVVELAPGDVPAHIHSVMEIAGSVRNPFEQVGRQEASAQAAPPEEVVQS
jgi:hypothetical protein